MRAITKPNYNFSEVYDACANSVDTVHLRGRLTSEKATIVACAVVYEQKAGAGRLFEIPVNTQQNDAHVTGQVTKQELKDLYSQHMVGAGKPARRIYDELRALAPLGKCPFCTIGDASTLDHYLPKAKFPLVSILPLNLVPSCKDCNTGEKKVHVATTIEDQCLHPYFDQSFFLSEQWVFASIAETSPPTISFHVNPPEHWHPVSKARAESHFRDFNLASRFSKQTTTELSALKYTLQELHEISGIQGVKAHLDMMARSYYRAHANSWQTAMYQALAESTWYCDGGFN
jgi:hypothetical protein